MQVWNAFRNACARVFFLVRGVPFCGCERERKTPLPFNLRVRSVSLVVGKTPLHFSMVSADFVINELVVCVPEFYPHHKVTTAAQLKANAIAQTSHAAIRIQM